MYEESLRLFNVFDRVIKGHTQSLSNQGVVASNPEHILCDTDPDHFTSKVRVFFYKQGQIVDVFEFHLFMDGRQQATARDIETWVEEHIPSVG